MILSHARLPIPTLPHVQNEGISPEEVNQPPEKLTNSMLSDFLNSRR